MSGNKGNTTISKACVPRAPASGNLKNNTHKVKPEDAALEALVRHGRVKTFWPKGLTPYPFQIDSVFFAVSRLKKHNAAYLALDPGLGKTICAALILNLLQEKKGRAKAFYVCPPFLTINTRNEFLKWCFNPELYLIPDSMLARKASQERTIGDLHEALEEWDGETILFIDEAHRFKNEKTGRTKALLKEILPLFDRVVWLSGSPLPNSRAKELWPQLHHTAPEVFGTNFFRYGLKYCGAYKTDFGWNFDGFTNRKEWRARVTKSFLLRLKKDVLDLPEKREGLLTVGDMPPVVSGVERKILEAYSEEDLVQGKIAAAVGADSLHLMTYLRLLGEYKLKYALPYIESLLEDTKENVLLFCVHKETVKKLRYALADYNPLVIDGSVPKQKRQGLVDEFQSDKTRRVFILNITAGGVGFTLTKAERVLFVEFSWVDGENGQASDRAHRIGLKHSLLVQYVVLKDSIDARRMEVLLDKRKKSI